MLLERFRLDPRQRAGLSIVALVYVVGWTVGRAAGRVEVTKQLLTRHAPGTRS
jgi:hypothetical protein